MNLISKEIRAQHQPYRRIKIPLIVYKEINNIENTTVEGWFSSQNSDTFPCNFVFNTPIYKGFYICDRYFYVTGGLGARTVAV
jgi:hypothetical protein